MDNREAACEAILFYYGAPLAIPKLAKLLGCTPKECRETLDALSARYVADAARGLFLLIHNEEATIGTKPELKSFLESLMKEEFQESLTPAALEALSLVSYLGPVTRATIDYIRGVNSTFTLRNLLLRGLIDRAPAEKGGGYEYRASVEFLKHMGIARVEELPEYEKYRTFYRDFELAGAPSKTPAAPQI